jgi:Trk K+ transport system NAD-binding subunit
MHTVIVSADDIGRELARRLIAGGKSVTMIDSDLIQINKARDQQFNAIHGDGTSAQDLKKAGIENSHSFVAATSSDKTNLLACQIAMQRFHVENVVARVNDPENVRNFESLGIRVTSPVISSAMLLESLVQRSSALELITSQVPGHEVCEIELSNPKMLRKPLKEWNLNEEVLVALVRRGDNLFIPTGATVLEGGDTLTLIGDCECIDDTRKMIEEG